MFKQTGIDLKSVMRDMMEERFRINFKTIFISTFPIRPGMDWPWLSLSFREPDPGPALLGQYGATNRTCSSSSLILHSVCASRLTGGNAYLRRPWGQLCASASVPSMPQIGSRTTGNGRFLEMQTGLPESLRTNCNQLDCLGSLHSPGSAARDSSLAAWLNTLGMWMAGSDLRCSWLQRRRWWASCGMRRECNRIVGWYTQRLPCCPYGP